LPAVLPFFCLFCLLSSSLSLLKLDHPETSRLFAASGSLILIALYCIFQLTPLPPSWLQKISPGTWQAYNETIWVLQPGVWMPSSIDFEKTLLAGLFVVSVGGLCLAVIQLAQNSRHLQELLHAIAFSVLVWSLIAIVVAILLVTQPFRIIDHDSWVSLLHTQCLFWSVVFLPIVIAGYSATRSNLSKRPFRLQFRAYLKAPVDHLHVIHVFAIALVIFSVLIALSPLYLIASLSGWLLLASIRQVLATNRNERKLYLSTSFAVISISGLIAFGRLLNVYAWSFQQSPVASIAIPPRWQFSWLGCGLGAQHDILIREVNPAGAADGYNGLNGLFSLWLGLGACGVSLSLLTCVALIIYGNRYRSMNTGRLTTKIYAGGLSSLILVVVLAVTDKHIAWPSVIAGAFLAAAIAAGAKASRHWTYDYSSEATKREMWAPRTIASVLLLVLTAGSLYLGTLAVTSFYQANVKVSVQPGHEVNLGETLVERAGFLNKWVPLNTSLKMAFGYRLLSLGLGSDALRMFSDTLLLKPLSPETLVAAVVTSAELGHDEQALKLLQSKAVERYRGGPHLENLVARALKTPESVVTKEFMTMAFSNDPRNSSRYLNLMLLAGYDLKDLRSHLPLRSEAIMAYGDILLESGEIDAAEIAYIEAVSLNSEEHSNVMTFIRVAEYFADSGKYSNALVVVRAGLDVFPDDSKLHQMAAELAARN